MARRIDDPAMRAEHVGERAFPPATRALYGENSTLLVCISELFHLQPLTEYAAMRNLPNL